jgi:hypothetical protein
MKVFLYIILFFISLASTSLLANCIFCYYLKMPTAIQIINSNLGGYEFIIWLIFIPNFFSTFFILLKTIKFFLDRNKVCLR